MVNPVPPRIKMRKGFTAFSANNDVDLARKARAVAADILRKRRRFMRSERDSSTSLGMTEKFRHDATRSNPSDRRNGGGNNFANRCARGERTFHDDDARHSGFGREVTRDRARFMANARCRS